MIGLRCPIARMDAVVETPALAEASPKLVGQELRLLPFPDRGRTQGSCCKPAALGTLRQPHALRPRGPYLPSSPCATVPISNDVTAPLSRLKVADTSAETLNASADHGRDDAVHRSNTWPKVAMRLRSM